MPKLWLIVKREYLTRVRTKAFILSTVSLPLLTIGIFLLTEVMTRRQADQPLKLAILDNAGGLATPTQQGLTQKLPNGQLAVQVVQTLDQPPDEVKARKELLAQVRQGQLDAYLVISRGAREGKAAEFHTKNPGDVRLAGPIRQALSEAIIARRLKDQGIRVDSVRRLIRGVDVTLVKVTERGETEEKGQTFFAAVVMATILYLTLLTYGISTMRSVLEEKTNRIVEILVASVRPFQLLAGKILGVAGVGLTQFLIWTITGGLLAAYARLMAASARPGSRPFELHLPASTLVYLVVLFLGGYFLYASLYAAIGAMVSSDEDAQQMQWPVTFLVVAAFLPLGVILRNPNSTLSIALSMFPFFTPILMFVRIALQTPPFWQIFLSLVILALTTLGLVFFSGKIYRVGVLMYGKRPSLVEILRWLRYT